VIPGYTPNPNARLSDRNEWIEIGKAWLGVALAFAILQSRSAILSGRIFQVLPQFLLILFISALTAGIAVILHEYGHRVVARYFGSDARIIANDQMLIFGIVLALAIGFLFFAPAAVVHNIHDRRKGGIVAAAGPVINMVLALIFAGLLLIAPSLGVSDLIYTVLSAGFAINALLGAFNMLPFGPIDGAKVLAWSAPVFGVLLAVAVGIAFGLPRLVPDVLPRIF
jgi:Zn-dependent protease